MKHTIHGCNDPTEALAKRIAEEAQQKDRFYLALSGGNSPKQMFSHMATTYRNDVPWEKLVIYQVDERGVGPDHQDSNWRMTTTTLLNLVPPVDAHRMEAEKDDAADSYELLLEQSVPQNEAGVPVFDLIILGMGGDGHTASLFPGTAALDEHERFVVRNTVPQLDTYRITLTYPVLNAAKARCFLVLGDDRLDVIRAVHQGEYPAGKIVDPEWYLDTAAAEQLQG